MLNLRKIAVTGGVASGKSTVCRFFQELGAFVVSSDAIVHELLQDLHSDLRREIVCLLGIDALTDAKLFRKAIAAKVFKDPNLLASLEKILHRRVIQTIEELYIKAAQKGTFSCFVVEMALLFEISAEKFYDVVITVLTDEAKAKARWIQSGFTMEEYEKRMGRQMNPLEKGNKSHYLLKNDSTLEDLKKQVISLYQTLQKN